MQPARHPVVVVCGPSGQPTHVRARRVDRGGELAQCTSGGRFQKNETTRLVAGQMTELSLCSADVGGKCRIAIIWQWL